MRKAQNAKLGYYLERANRILSTSTHNSIRSSRANSSTKERSFDEISHDKHEIQKPYKRENIFYDSGSHLTVATTQTLEFKKSQFAPSPKYLDRCTPKDTNPDLKSFITDKLSPTSLSGCTKNDNHEFSTHSSFRKSVNHPLISKLDCISPRSKDANELKSFIEIEDY